MAVKHTFKNNLSNDGYGYYGYIEKETDLLVIGESWPREGGDIFKGTYLDAKRHGHMNDLKVKAPRLYNSIIKYYTQSTGKEVTQRLTALKPGDRFVRVSSKDPNFKDETKYMLIDMEISKCFVAGDNLSAFVSALDLNNYKVYCFSRDSEVIKEE